MNATTQQPLTPSQRWPNIDAGEQLSISLAVIDRLADIDGMPEVIAEAYELLLRGDRDRAAKSIGDTIAARVVEMVERVIEERYPGGVEEEPEPFDVM